MKKTIAIFLIFALTLAMFGGCHENERQYKAENYANRSYYEVFVGSFYDSDNDGIGDIKGLIEKFDYINDGDLTKTDDLNLNGIWLMPINQSTTYHKYDVVDYYAIDESYGSMKDFDELLALCEKRDVNLIIDLVINHSSSKHEWFLSAKNTILENADKTLEEIIEINDKVGYYNFSKESRDGDNQLCDGWFYESRFWSEMPDLNLSNSAVKNEIAKIVKFYLDKGVGGFRLDAVKEFYSGDTDKNLEFLTWFVKMVKEIDPDAYVVGEAWDTEFNTLEQYKSGIDSMFNFEFAMNTGEISKFINSTNGEYFANQIQQQYERIENINEKASVANFYTNHDTARANGYFVNSVAKVKFAQGINQLLSGTSFLYYGEEIGMSGSGKDENKRLAFIWDKGKKTYTTRNPVGSTQNTFNYEGVDKQLKDENSILSYMKKAINLRNKYPQISSQKPSVIACENKDLCVLKRGEDENAIVTIFYKGDVPATIDISKFDCKKMIDELASGDKVTANDTKITLSPYSIVILK